MADLKITELAALAGADLAAGDLLAIADISASETKKITVTDFLGNAVTLIADATIPGAKILFGSATIPGSALEEGAVNTSKLAAGAVTAAKLADESTVDLVTALPVSGAFIGQLALDTSTSKAYIWNGSSWVSFKAAGSINTAIGSTAGVVNVTVTTSGDQITIGTTLDDTANAAEFLAGPSGAGGAVSYRAIVGADLPVATTTAKGGVQVNGNGLTMSGDTLAIDNTITPNTTEYHLIQYDGNGLVTDGRQIQAGDLPLASVGLVGAVYPGTGLSVSSDGEINHTNVIAAGTATKITFDAEGHVTAGDALADTDIPNISAGKLTSGTLDVARIANRSIEGEKLADYATAKISNAAPTAEYIGQLFFNPLDRTLFMWDGNVYQPIGVSFGQIIFSGTYDANTNLVSSVTTDGAAIGLAVGASLVSPTGATRAHYVVVDIAGTGTAPAPAVALAPPDIILSTGTDWTLLDVSDTVVAQLASNVQVTPAGDIASTNVQAALQELDTEKLPKAGGTMTGNLELGAAVDIIFEGANANANETTLTVVDPTADRTITLPDVTGTVVTTGDTGTVTSTMIADGTIVNADINASAAIADTKLATIVSSGKVSNSATTATNANTASAIVARDASGNFSAGTITANLTGTASAIADNTVTSAKIVDGTIVNADVNASAAIAGTKISPDFGSQNVVTTGTATAASLNPTGSSVPTNGVYLPAANNVAISTNGTGRLFIDSSGRVLVGASTSRNSDSSGTQYAAQLQIESGSAGGIAVSRFVDSASAQTIALQKGRGSVNTPVVVNSGDGIGNINFSGHDGTILVNAARVSAEVDGTPGTGVMPGRLVFSTTPSGSGLPTERMRLDSSGRLGLGTSSPGAALDVTSNIFTRIFNTTAPTLSNDTHAGEALYIRSGGSAGDNNVQAVLAFGKADGASVRTGSAIGSIQTTSDPDQVGLAFYTSVSTTSSQTLSEKVRITHAGNVGIGTTSPAVNLHVSAASGAVTARVQSGTNSGDIAYSGNELYVANNVSGPINLYTGGSERARIDSSGRLLVGTSSAYQVGGFSRSAYICSIASENNTHLVVGASGTSGFPALYFTRTRTNLAKGDASTAVEDNDTLGIIEFYGANGTDFSNRAASVICAVDGEPFTSGDTTDLPGRLVMSVTLDGASSPTEALRITNDRVIAYNQAAPAAVNATATLTVANLKTGIITSTSAAATDMTLPTGTDTEGGFSGIYTNMTFEWSVINTGPSLVTVLADTAHTLVGSGAVATGTSARFASRRTAANTFVSYRLS